MTSSKLRTLVLTGYASDLGSVMPRLAVDPANTTLVDENGFESALPAAADVVVFALSRGGTYSTQLRIVCNRVFYQVSTDRRFLLALGGVDLDDRAFPEFADLPRTSIEELNALLGGAPDRSYSNL